MRITFIYPDLIGSPDYPGYFYTGVAYLSAVLKKAGHMISLLHISQPITREEFMHTLKITQPDIIAFSATTNMFYYVKMWSRLIKEQMSIPIICGGIHPTLYPDDVISDEDIDIICIGEGEEAFLELCDAIEKGRKFTSIRNLWVKENGRVYRNPLRPLLENLDNLPFSDRAIYDYPNLYHEREGRAVIMASRGCPYNCFYCCNHALRNTFKGLGSYVRFRSVTNVIAEIKQVVARYSFIKALAFDDDVLPLRKKWLGEFVDNYSREVAMPFTCNIYPALIDEDTVSMLKVAGCVEVHIGVESGNEYIRNKILNRLISNEDILKAISLCKNAGLRIYTYNMVGIPSEGIKEMLDTVKLNAKCFSDINQVSIFFPYKGTKLYEICEEEGLLTSKLVTNYFNDSALNYPKSKLNQILFVKSYFRILVRLYSLLDRQFSIFRKIGDKIFDCSLSSRISCYFFFPLAEMIFKALYRQKQFYKIARLLKRRFLDSLSKPRKLF